jgi:tetratricopeptide (TPR) repeat protein
MARGLLPALLACALLVPLPTLAQTTTPAPAPAIDKADDEEARDLFQIGKDAFDEGRFERALKYFKEAYELSHRGALLSNIGTALDRLRRDQEAVDTYKQYLVQVPQAGNRKLIEDRIRIIEAALARSQPAPPAAVPIAAPPPAAKPEPAPLSPPPRAAEPLVPTPQETARAAQSLTPQHDPQQPRDTGEAPITSKWWFWTGIGAVAVAAVIVVVAVSAGGGSAEPAQPTLLDPTTRVRRL